MAKAKKSISRFFTATKAIIRGNTIAIVVTIFLLIAIWAITKILPPFIEKTISDLAFATGILAIATIALAFITYLSIRNTNEREKRETKERKLRDVISWATDCCDVVLKESMLDTTNLSDFNAREYMKRKLIELNEFRLLRAKSIYILTIADQIPSISTEVNSLTDMLKNQIKNLFEYNDTKITDIAWAPKIAKQFHSDNEQLYGFATELIKKASNEF